MCISKLFKKIDVGQSLVEMALVLPLVLTMIIGMVEIGQYLITTNRIRTAANTSARFAANGGQHEGVAIVAINAITQTLPVEEGRWDIWSIRGQVNEQGTGLDETTWEFVHVYGVGNTQEFTTVVEADIQAEVFTNLQRQLSADGTGTDEGNQDVAAGTQFAGSLVLFDAQSILGLEYFLEDMFTVRALNIMRTFPVNPTTNGCTAFPIAIEEGVRSVRPQIGNQPSTFPAPNWFSYYKGEPQDDPPPVYEDFPGNEPDIPFTSARPGYIYKIFNGTGSGNFGWLNWNQYVQANTPHLIGSLTWPGNSDNYTSDAGNPIPPGTNPLTGQPFEHGVYGFINVADDEDTDMHIGDWIAANPGINSAAWSTMDVHIERGRALRLIVWKNGAGGSGNNDAYQISRFAVMRLIGYRSNNGGGGEGAGILAEFVSWDDSCGQVNQ